MNNRSLPGERAMQEIDRSSVKKAVALYEECLSGNIKEAGTLAILLFLRIGLLDAVTSELKNSSQVTLSEFHGNMLRFMFAWMLDCLERSRLGQNMLPELYDALQQATIYKSCLARDDGCCIYVNTQIEGVIRGMLDEAESDFLQNLGTSRQELAGLVLKFGQLYVQACRSNPTRQTTESLALLVESCGLGLESVGTNPTEFLEWRRQVNLKTLKASLKYLRSNSLPRLLVDRERTLAALRDLEILVDDGKESWGETQVSWLDDPCLLSHELVDLNEDDQEMLRRIRAEFPELDHLTLNDAALTYR